MALAFCPWLVQLFGCSRPHSLWGLSLGGWHQDYESAEAERIGGKRPMLIYFKDAAAWTADPTYDALRSGEFGRKTHAFVKCMLVRSYEGDRRYVAQYGVVHGPAVILVHADGTYHARVGAMSAADLVAFVDSSTPPGAVPRIDPFVPRTVDYAWIRSLDEAEAIARRTGKPMLIVLERWMSGDRRRMESMLAQPEVHRRFAEMVPCRPGSLWSGVSAASRRFGVTRLPAMVIARPDGAVERLELQNSAEAIVRFADRAAGPHQRPAAEPSSAALSTLP